MIPPEDNSSLPDKGLPPAFLNHVVITLDTPTHREVEQSAFLRGFAVTEQRTTTTNRGAHTGFYLYGTHTYLEFVRASKKQPAGSSGVALGVDRTGALQALVDAATPHLVVEGPVTREYEGEPVPWFYLGGRAGFSADFTVWLMEYHPQFLARWHPRSAGQGVSRKEVLRRYREVVRKSSNAAPTPYFGDIVGLNVVTGEKTHHNLTELGAWLGYDEHDLGGETLLRGPELGVRLVRTTTEASGVREVTMRVERQPKDEEYRFGPTTLRFHGDGLATWTFRPEPD